jgi:hypothetical protein
MGLRFSKESPNYNLYKGRVFELHRKNDNRVVLTDSEDNLVIADTSELEIAHDPDRMGIDIDVFSSMLEYLCHRPDCKSVVSPSSDCSCGLSELQSKIHKTFLGAYKKNEK